MRLEPQFLFDCWDPLHQKAVKLTIKDLEAHFQLKSKPKAKSEPKKPKQ